MTGKIYSVKSPAKINIGLYVKNIRKDGFHNIETIFYPIGLNDEIKVKIEQTSNPVNYISVKDNNNSKLSGRQNICYRAVKLFFDEMNISGKFNIYIDIKKNIPVGAGLGGGSSNAAAVLKVLSKYFRLVSVKPISKQSQSRINKIASRLGSDIPFFLLGKPAYASLRGERLTFLPKFKIKHSMLLVNPNIHISTKWAYDTLDTRYQIAKSKNNTEPRLREIQKFNINEADLFQNDFEQAVFKKYPEVGEIKDDMYEYGAVFSSMSGSGSTVYGFFEKGINSAAKYFRGKGYWVYIIRSL
jgi:4-diphosphocytidyl-2-C-methyl-D-erythritol kinase